MTKGAAWCRDYLKGCCVGFAVMLGIHGCQCEVPRWGLEREREAELLRAGNTCNNESDTAEIVSGWDGRSSMDVAADCGLGCIDLTKGSSGDCVFECLSRHSGGALSRDCSDCITYAMSCVAENCQIECAPLLGGSPSSLECRACQCGQNRAQKNCHEEFRRCGGIPTPRSCPDTPNVAGTIDPVELETPKVPRPRVD